jgi:hypothetical protein
MFGVSESAFKNAEAKRLEQILNDEYKAEILLLASLKCQS